MGRPSKFTPETTKAIIDAVRLGATKRDAAVSAGVDYMTFNNWMQAGEKAKSGKFFEFFEAVKRAEAECLRNFTFVIAKAAQGGDWRAAHAYLKAHDRALWGDNVDVTSGGKSFEKMTDDQLLAILSAISKTGSGETD